jgi:hypothetical protein
MNKKAKDIPLSGKQLHDMILEMEERPNIIESKKITSSSTVKDIFGDSGHAIIFHSHGPQSKVGHWLSIVRNYDGDVYFHDSLGESPDKYNKNIAKTILKEYPKLYYNDIAFQKDDTSTCGRHSVLVCALNKMKYKPHQIEQVFKEMKNPDDFVLELVKKN